MAFYFIPINSSTNAANNALHSKLVHIDGLENLFALCFGQCNQLHFNQLHRYFFLTQLFLPPMMMLLFFIVEPLLLRFRFLAATTESTVSNVFAQIAVLKKVWGGKRHRVFVIIVIIILPFFSNYKYTKRARYMWCCRCLELSERKRLLVSDF